MKKLRLKFVRYIEGFAGNSLYRGSLYRSSQINEHREIGAFKFVLYIEGFGGNSLMGVVLHYRWLVDLSTALW